MKNKKKVISGVLLLTFFILGGMSNQRVKVYASEIANIGSASSETEIQIIAYDSENNRSLAVVSTHTPNADVYGNGVRLRNAPNDSATILELMYDGEYVWIDWSQYGRGEGGFDWYYIQRIKTGTYGWTLCDYIGSRD